MALLKMGCSVGEGEPVNVGKQILYVDSWSPGAGVVWLRHTRERDPAGGLLTIKGAQLKRLRLSITP